MHQEIRVIIFILTKTSHVCDLGMFTLHRFIDSTSTFGR